MAIRKIVSRSIGTDVIAAEDLANNSVTVAEITDGAVTAAKLNGTLDISSKTITLPNDVIDSANIVDGAVDDVHLATGISSSKLTGALPALDGSALTGITTTGRMVKHESHVWNNTVGGNDTGSTYSTYQDATGSSFSYTPVSSGNTIVVVAVVETGIALRGSYTGNNYGGVKTKLYKDSSQIGDEKRMWFRDDAIGQTRTREYTKPNVHTAVFETTSTSALTFKISWASDGVTAGGQSDAVSVGLNQWSAPSKIDVFEYEGTGL